MKTFDMLKLSFKSLRSKWVALTIFIMVIGVFCLSFAGAIWISIREEKAQAYELIFMPNENKTITQEDIIEISKLQGVVDVSPVYFIPVLMKTGAYSAQLTLTGIDGEYIEEPFIEGGVYPESSAMPYIVLNKVALMEFLDADSDRAKEGEPPNIDWLNAGFFLTIHETRRIVSKVCGILASDSTSNITSSQASQDRDQTESVQNPQAYISLDAAKDLLQRSGQNLDYMAVYVRVVNIGEADKVSREVDALGLTVSNSSEELQMGWDALTREMLYLMVAGILFLLCSSALIIAWRKISFLEEKQSWTMLQWIGMKDRNIRKIFSIQGVIISTVGWAIGSIIAVSLPSFLSQGDFLLSTFTLPIPLEAILLSFLLSIIIGQLPLTKV